MRRLPAEWEPQDAVMLTWPHEGTDWASQLDETLECYRQIIEALLPVTHVIIAAPPAKVDDIYQYFNHHQALSVFGVPSNDTWARDHGPIGVETENGLALLDFVFNGWGNKFDAELDNQISHHLTEYGAFGQTPLLGHSLILEGGAIESDGKGTLLTTSACLLNPNRNPNLSKDEIEQQLKTAFGVTRVLWLNHGFLEGDDTDSHIDTLVRLAPDSTIVYTQCTDHEDAHFPALQAMESQLHEFKTKIGGAFRLFPLPWPQAQFDDDGNRLPATYANYLVTNTTVLLPTYGAPQDEAALKVIAKAYPDREIIGIDCRALIQQHGSLHCITMQLPQGVLR